MTYSETLEYLYSRLPMFTRIGAAAIKKDLHNTIALCEHLGNPQHKFKTIHIAGTNGKGSTSHMLAAVLQKAGYKTGLYTSPHLKDFRERIRINGEMIPESFVTDFVAQEKELIEDISPSFFEVTVGLAFDYFAKEKVDIAVIETGLGGRLDSTNIITPELSVITNISLDHTNLLGNTIPEIAYEKAGIIKNQIPVVIGERQAETTTVFVDKAAETNSAIIFASDLLHVSDTFRKDTFLITSVYQEHSLLYPELRLDLTGSYQLKNILTVIQSVILLNKIGFEITDEAITSAIANTKGLTGLRGRWDILSEHPLIICDTGHNVAGIKEVMENINATPHDQLHIVIGMLKDKDITTVLQLLPASATYYFCQPDLERAMSAEELSGQAKAFNLKGNIFGSVAEAIGNAKANADPNDLIFIGGSTFVVAEAL
ncbi:bifunctional folylpolyglutamate synthase/dihydrofolate synthase [Pedobacter sp. MR2016-24]|uniref:bifunctional folylpolyglutamate synthase/dihydrofolate synthase n=1 Tax=Pedobacter sp. MR2016-24 TaxID=2994466 RepID=UPI002245704F|nr:folylpolyglutamate synthase/dihydrofolate synthase family protein [Pedobacter sp. MR2016-24]MCX2482686.1 bifunctional folylpolyglutamate synthase/dihydrofolate synthase [Pedobacter sp. MR2016-24]